MTIYDDAIMRLAKSTAGAGALDGAVTARQTNPLCGDDCTLHLKLDGAQITAAAHQTRGCALTLAAAEKLIQLAAATPQLPDMAALSRQFEAALKTGAPLPPPLALFTPVIPRKSRHSCLLLPYQALLQITPPPPPTPGTQPSASM